MPDGVPQALSFGLTQYDVEELKEYCNGRCAGSVLQSGFPAYVLYNPICVKVAALN